MADSRKGDVGIASDNPSDRSFDPGKLQDLSERSDKEKRRHRARAPKAVANVVAAVMAKRGYAASKAADELNTGWAVVASRVLGGGAIAGQTRAAGLVRGRLEVLVANHVVMQEINFHRPQLLAAIQEALPTAKITSIRFKTGRLA